MDLSLETLLETGVDEMSWDDTVRAFCASCTATYMTYLAAPVACRTIIYRLAILGKLPHGWQIPMAEAVRRGWLQTKGQACRVGGNRQNPAAAADYTRQSVGECIRHVTLTNILHVGPCCARLLKRQPILRFRILWIGMKRILTIARPGCWNRIQLPKQISFDGTCTSVHVYHVSNAVIQDVGKPALRHITRIMFPSWH